MRGSSLICIFFMNLFFSKNALKWGDQGYFSGTKFAKPEIRFAKKLQSIAVTLRWTMYYEEVRCTVHFSLFLLLNALKIVFKHFAAKKSCGNRILELEVNKRCSAPFVSRQNKAKIKQNGKRIMPTDTDPKENLKKKKRFST